MCCSHLTVQVSAAFLVAGSMGSKTSRPACGSRGSGRQDACGECDAPSPEHPWAIPFGSMRAGAAASEESSPSRIRNNRRFLREKLGVGKKATQKTTHSPIRMIPQEVAPGPRAVFGKGPRQANPPTRHPLSNQATAGRASETAVMYT